MCIRIGGITIRISFLFAVFFAVLANISVGRNILISFLFSFAHEIVHLIFLYFSGIKKAEIVLLPGGIRIICEELSSLSYKKTVLCSLSAPVFNIVAGAFFYILHTVLHNDVLLFCSVSNFVLGAINLFPLKFLDGGRAVEALLCRKYDSIGAEKLMGKFSVLSLIVLFALFFIGCIMGKIQIFLLIFCIYCFLGIFSEKRTGHNLYRLTY